MIHGVSQPSEKRFWCEDKAVMLEDIDIFAIHAENVTLYNIGWWGDDSVIKRSAEINGFDDCLCSRHSTTSWFLHSCYRCCVFSGGFCSPQEDDTGQCSFWKFSKWRWVQKEKKYLPLLLVPPRQKTLRFSGTVLHIDKSVIYKDWLMALNQEKSYRCSLHMQVWKLRGRVHTISSWWLPRKQKGRGRDSVYRY